MEYGILLQYLNKPYYLKFGVVDTDIVGTSTGYFSGYDVHNGVYLKYGTDLMTAFFGSTPETNGDTFTYDNTEIVLPILSTTNSLSVAWSHTTGVAFYWFRVRVIASDDTVLYTKELTAYCSDQSTAYLYSPQLVIAPNVTTSSDVTLFGYSWLKYYDSTLGSVNAGYIQTGIDFESLFGEFSAVPSYPSGGVEPTDVFGGDESNFDATSDDIDVPTVIEGAIDNGLVKSYLISPTQLNTMMADITNFDDTTLATFLDNLSMLYNSPIEAIISIKKFCIDFSEVPIGDAENVYLLTYQTSATANPITSQYARIDVGSIDVAQFFGGFLDYPPYTRCTIYLPFIGEQELNVQEIMDSTIHLYYMVDFLTGNCVAHLNVEKSAGETNLNSDLYQWEGNMACDVPLTATDFHQILGNFFNNGFSALASGLTGNIGGVLDSIGGAFGVANTGKVMSGAISGSSALMGVRVPYIKIENPIQTVPDNFQELRGLAGNINHTIGDLSGFLRCREVDINNITATDDEKAELYALLTGGIFV